MKNKNRLFEIFAIASPMIIGNIGHVLTGVTDVFVAAKHSINTLASIAVANSILFTVLIVGIGFLSGISIQLSNYRGEKRFTKKYFLSCILLSQIIAFISFLIIIGLTCLISLFGFEQGLVKNIQEYMFIISFSVFGMFLYQAIKEFLQAHEIVNFPNFILLFTVVLNLILNYIFVFGIEGIIPEMGAKGLAVATFFVRMLLALLLVLYTGKILVKQQSQEKIHWDYIKSVIKLGLPIGTGLLFESIGFNIITIALGKDSELLVATHNILLILVETTFMIPLAVSSAIAIKVGFFNGAGDIEEIKNYSKIGVGFCTLFMSICSVFFVCKPQFFIGIFTSDAHIIEIAIPIITLFALFEIADGLQISLSGILKGLKKTKEVTLCVLSSYWFVGIPLGFYMAYRLNMSLKGFWLGLTISLFLIALSEWCIIFKSIKNYKSGI